MPLLNDLSWSAIGMTSPVLFQRKQQFGTVDDFLAHPPTNALIGTYAYDKDFGTSKQQLPNYQPATTDTVIDTPLRGKHTMYIYLHHEPFHMIIEKQDLNWYEDPDPMTVTVYKDNDIVFQETVDDDGITDNSRKILPSQKIEIKNPGPDLPENGVYKVVIDANSDTIVKKITTNLHKIVFAGSVFPAGNNNVYGSVIATTSATTLYTNALLLSATTYHNAGLQNITVGNQTIHMEEINNIYPITPLGDITNVIIPKGDIIINGFQGYFAFSQDQFFNPTPYHILPINSKYDIPLVDYIITDYHPSTKIGDWQVAERTFDLQTATIKNNTLSWIIVAPQLNANNREILINNIDITFRKKPLL